MTTMTTDRHRPSPLICRRTRSTHSRELGPDEGPVFFRPPDCVAGSRDWSGGRVAEFEAGHMTPSLHVDDGGRAGRLQPRQHVGVR